MIVSQKYFFRDLNHEDSFKDGRTYHASGLAELYSEIGSPKQSGKDVSVIFKDPFGNCTISQWRAFDEIKLFECEDYEYESVFKSLNL